MIIEYGMITDEKFFERAEKFFLVQNIDGTSYTLDEYVDKIKALQTDKDGTTVVLYAASKEGQHAYIEKAKNQGYDTILLDSPIVSHWMQKIEGSKQKIRFARVDSDLLDKLIPKDGERPTLLTEDETKLLKTSIEAQVDTKRFTVRVEALESDDAPMVVTVPEFMRRMREMSATGGGGFMGMGDLPESFDLVVNGNHALAGKILRTPAEEQGELILHAKDLALLQQNLLHGEALTSFVKRAMEKMV
jgi:molecular chaperone HtpG